MKSSAKKSAKTHRRPKNSAKKEAASASLFSLRLRSFFVTVLIAVGTILLASLGAYFTPDPDRFIALFSLFALALTAFLGGFFAGKKQGVPALSGSINALLLIALMLLLSLFFRGGTPRYDTGVSILLYVAILPVSVLGALVGSQKR